MSPKLIGAAIDAAIPFAGGLYITLLAYRLIGKDPNQDPRWKDWHERFGTLGKVLGPFLIVISAVLFAVACAEK